MAKTILGSRCGADLLYTSGTLRTGRGGQRPLTRCSFRCHDRESRLLGGVLSSWRKNVTGSHYRAMRVPAVVVLQSTRHWGFSDDAGAGFIWLGVYIDDEGPFAEFGF